MNLTSFMQRMIVVTAGQTEFEPTSVFTVLRLMPCSGQVLFYPTKKNNDISILKIVAFTLYTCNKESKCLSGVDLNIKGHCQKDFLVSSIRLCCTATYLA